MTNNLKIEVLVSNIPEDGSIASQFPSREYVNQQLAKKANLSPEGRLDPSHAPDYTEIPGLYEHIEDTKDAIETSIADSLQNAKGYTNQQLSTGLRTKADLVNGKIPFDQIPFSADIEDQIQINVENITAVVDQKVAQVVEQVNGVATAANSYTDTKVAETKTYVDTTVGNVIEDVERLGVSKAVTIPTYLTPEAGVAAGTGVAAGSYFNVRSTTEDDSIAVEYRNIGGVATPTGKEYPSYTAVERLQEGYAIKKYLLDNGVGESELDTDYDFLMQRLAQIAVDKGLDASFVVDGNENQHQINKKTIRHVASVSEMLLIQNPFSGQAVTTVSYVFGLNKGGAKYTYDATRAAENNGITCINGWVKNNTSKLLASQAGCREGDFENTDPLNNLILVASNEGIKEVILDGFYKIGKLEKGITTTPFGDENAWWLLKARSNVTVKGRSWSDGLFIAGGLVDSNKSEPNPKGYMVFGDYNQSDVENFKIENFTIDNNGQENLLPAVVGFGAQALCPNVWFQRGKNIGVFDIHFKDNPGHQTIVLDSGVKGAKVIGNTFTDNGKGLPNNANIVDHSTVYVRATGFWVTNNTFTFETLKPDISTALEIHGVDGHVYGNTTNGYPFPLIRASFFGQSSKNVKVHDNTFNGCNYGLNLDGADNSPLYVDVYSNTFNFRAEKPTDGKSQVAVGHTATGGFNTVTPTSAHDIVINVKNNVFNQPTPTGGWTKFNEFDNCMWDGGKCTEVYFEGNIFNGFKGCYRINYANGKTRYSFNDKLINCGSQNTDSKSNVFIQNIDASWSGNIVSILNSSKLEFCLYDSLVYFLNAASPLYMRHTNESTNWILPYEGESPDNSNLIIYDYSVRVVDPNKILWSQGVKVAGKITLPNDQYFYKDYGYVGRWNMHRRLTVMPASPRFFGDIKGDIVTIRNSTTGQPSGAVCTVSGVDVNTVGTWKGYGVVL